MINTKCICFLFLSMLMFSVDSSVVNLNSVLYESMISWNVQNLFSKRELKNDVLIIVER